MASNNTIVAPSDWDAFVGQSKLKRRLMVSIEAALNDGRPLDHVLLASEPGYGKSTLGRLIAMELGSDFTPLMMPVKTKALQKVFLEAKGVLLLDEFHRLKKKEQEELLLPLEEGCIQLSSGEKVPIPGPLTIIAATTEEQDIIKAVRSRFTHKPKFEQYSDEDMEEIVRRMSIKVDLDLSDEECAAYGKASAGVPRQARTIIFTARDLGFTDPSIVLDTCGITEDGLTEDHVDYLVSLDTLGRQAGLDVLANHTGMPKDILMDLEKLLVRKRYVTYGGRGREMTVIGMKRTQELMDAA